MPIIKLVVDFNESYAYLEATLILRNPPAPSKMRKAETRDSNMNCSFVERRKIYSGRGSTKEGYSLNIYTPPAKMNTTLEIIARSKNRRPDS